jgi:hypothetical protein
VGVSIEDAARAVLAEIGNIGVVFGASEPAQEKRFSNLGRATGKFLLFIVRVMRRRHIVGCVVALDPFRRPTLTPAMH